MSTQGLATKAIADVSFGLVPLPGEFLVRGHGAGAGFAIRVVLHTANKAKSGDRVTIGRTFELVFSLTI